MGFGSLAVRKRSSLSESLGFSDWTGRDFREERMFHVSLVMTRCQTLGETLLQSASERSMLHDVWLVTDLGRTSQNHAYNKNTTNITYLLSSLELPQERPQCMLMLSSNPPKQTQPRPLQPHPPVQREGRAGDNHPAVPRQVSTPLSTSGFLGGCELRSA